MTGIYKISSLIDNRIYVGSAVNIDKRKYVHFHTLRNNKHKNAKLQNFYNKYGENNLKFEVIEYCNKDTLIEREQHYIDTLLPVFNIAKTAGSNLGIKFTGQALENMRDSHPGYTIYQYDLEGRYIQSWNRPSEIANVYKCSRTGINKCCTGRFASYIGYLWSYNKLEKLEPYVNPRSSPVYQYDKDGLLITCYTSNLEASEKLGVVPNFISKVCMDDRGTVNGFYITKKLYSPEEIMIRNDKRKVYVFDLNQNMIYDSYHREDISIKFDISLGSIARHLNSKKDKPFKKLYFRYSVNFND